MRLLGVIIQHVLASKVCAPMRCLLQGRKAWALVSLNFKIQQNFLLFHSLPPGGALIFPIHVLHHGQCFMSCKATYQDFTESRDIPKLLF